MRKSTEERGMEMDEYIKKETAYRAIMGERPEAREPSWFAELVLEVPAADVVEVVRCRDCKHRGTDYCIFHIKGEPADEELLRKLDNDFCSYGERKDGGKAYGKAD